MSNLLEECRQLWKLIVIACVLTVEIVVEKSEAAIKSIELQLVRVETCGCAEGYAKECKCRLLTSNTRLYIFGCTESLPHLSQVSHSALFLVIHFLWPLMFFHLKKVPMHQMGLVLQELCACGEC